MSLQLAAHHLASKGRGPDTMLVHMAPSEVHGLQALARAHGGTLTVNPDTGLPEAGFLSKILPTIAGVGLSVLSGGTLTPLMAGMITGGVTGLATGDLRKGLMAGLGAYGGAGLGASISGLGAAANAAEAVSPTIGPAALAEAAPATGVTVGGPIAAPAVEGVALPPSEYAGFAPTTSQYGAFGEAPVPTAAAAPIAAPAPTTGMPELGADANAKDMLLQRGEVTSPAIAPTKSPFDTFKAGLQEAAKDPSKLMTPSNMMTIGSALLPALMGGKSGVPSGSGPNPYEYTYDYKTGQYTRVPTGTRDSRVMTPNVPMQRMAVGGPVEAMSERNVQEMLMANGGVQYARGGLSHLGDYSDGGRLLRGPGDGVSDSIPAVIGNKRPARLADGEFVVPARIVSELGNGSTDAGARKLYSMMDRVQKNRSRTVGKGKVAVNSRSDKFLPA